MAVTLSYIFGSFLLGTLVLKIRNTVVDSLRLSGLTYIYAWLFYALLYVCVWCVSFLLRFLGITIQWADVVFDSKWYVQGGLFCLLILVLLLEGGRTKVSKGRHTRNTTNVKPVVSPDRRRSKQAESVCLSPKNITTISNDVSKGISTAVSFKSYNQHDIVRLAVLAAKSGAIITLRDLDKVQTDTLAGITKEAPGHVYLDKVVDAGFDAEKLARSGACFTCNCKNRSTSITEVARCAAQGKGRVTLTNCRWMSSSEMSKLRSLGGRFIEIQ